MTAPRLFPIKRDVMNLKPLSNRVIIEIEEEEKTTKSGIVIPETAEKGDLLKGKVVAAGPGKYADNGQLIPVRVKEGDAVFFEKPYGSKKIDEKYLLISEDDIQAIIEELPR